MKFGYCANLNFMFKEDAQSKALFDAVLSSGYDYIELPLSVMLNLSDVQYKDLKIRLSDSGVPCRANFLLFPHELPLVGAEQNLLAIKEHAKKVLPIAAELGSEVVVFGNGGSRRVREGMKEIEVRAQIIDILKTVEPIAAQYGIQIALEPLCKKETNMVTKYSEAAEIARLSGEHIGAVCDLYHVISDGQSPKDILEAPDKLFHLHIAYPDGRTVPAPYDDRTHYLAFAQAVKACGYDKRLSIEAAAPKENIEYVLSNALKLLRDIFN